MKKLCRFTLISLVAGFSMTAQASLITNGSFEADDVDLIDYNGKSSWEVFDSITGWTTESGSGIEIQSNDTLSYIDAQDGDQYVELDSHYGTDTNSFMSQEITGLTEGSYYELAFWYMPRTTTDGDNGIEVFWWDDTDDVTVMDSVVVADDSYDRATIWTEITVTLLATAETMYIGFAAFGLENTYGGLIDNVSLVAVPEPATLALFAVGLAGLAASRKRSL